MDDLRRRAEQRLDTLRRAARERAQAIQRLIEEHLDEPEASDMDDLVREAEEIIAEAEELASTIEEELSNEAPDADYLDWPLPDDGFENPLFDSTREYVEQMDRYKEHQGKPTERRERTFVVTTRKCITCGKSFEASRGRKHCSQNCYKKTNRGNRNTAKREKLRGQRVAELGDRFCEVCGGKIESLNPRSKYCSRSCANKRVRG
jgi:predicted nucleic acid-binding Zn ribbon protein